MSPREGSVITREPSKFADSPIWFLARHSFWFSLSRS